MSVEATLADMAGEDSDETQGWEAGLDFAKTLKAGVLMELGELRRLKFSQAYIDAWKASAESIFYTLTDEVE
jgi:hypothetical protein